jgi:DNA-binding transcriptional LysR family regulator
MDVHVRDLRYFVAVAEELSFTRAAAERLFISQPALSKQIRQLESALRVALFERDKRTVALAQAGEALLPLARGIIEQWDAAQHAVAEAAVTQTATLAVGFQTSIGRGLIPAVTASMREVLPNWKLVLRQIAWDDPTVGLEKRAVDVAIAWLPIPDREEFSHKVIASEDRWVALPSGHHLASEISVDFNDLAGEPFIALPRSAGVLRDFWLASDQRTSPVHVAAEVTTPEETFEAVASGIGVVLLSAGNATIYKRDGVVFRPVGGLSPSELAVVWRTGDQRPAVRLFIDACVRAAS